MLPVHKAKETPDFKKGPIERSFHGISSSEARIVGVKQVLTWERERLKLCERQRLATLCIVL